MLLQWPWLLPIRLAQFRGAAEGLGWKSSPSPPLHSPKKFGKGLQDFCLTIDSLGYPQAGPNFIPRASAVPGPSALAPLHWSCMS